jgi:hypothetical protein
MLSPTPDSLSGGYAPSETARPSQLTVNAEEGSDPGHIADLIGGTQLARLFADPARDPRVPDLIVQPQHGVIYTTYAGTIAEHGGGTQDDRNVVLLIVPGGTNHHPATVYATVTTTQIAPTILTYLGLDPHRLQALRQEPTNALHPHGS